MKKGLFVAAASAAICLMMTSAASAATLVETTYTGRVTSGQDWTGVFGIPQLNFDDEDFTAVFLTDMSKGTRTTVPGTSDILGGNGVNAPSEAWLTIGGLTWNFVNPTSTSAQVIGEQRITNLVTRIDGSTTGVVTQFILALSTDSPDVPYLLTDEFDMDSGANVLASYFQISSFDYGTSMELASAFGNLRVGDVRSRLIETGAIPEPGTWALMILGFGGAGAMLRRKRQRMAYA